MQVKKQQLEPDMEQQIGSKQGKEYVKAVLSSCLFNVYAEYIMPNARLDESQAGIKSAGKISITSDMQMTPPYGRKWKGAKQPVDEDERVKKPA